MTVERNDPTVSGFTPPAAGPACLSGNEVETLCLKAARGAGMAWGLAEEAGFAARWLYTRGVDGPSALLSHLDWSQDHGWDEVRPIAIGEFRSRAGALLCPITLGATLSDCTVLPEEAVGPLHAPILLLPFLHHLGGARGRTITAEWDGMRVAIGAEGGLSGQIDALMATDRAVIALKAAERSREAPPAPTRLPPISRATLARLNDYAMRTTVPASGSSRADAGSASCDND